MRCTFAFLLASLALAACDSGSPENVVGSYQVERFRVTESGETADFAAAGGQFDLVLTDDGAFTASIETPDIAEIEGDQSFAADFDGTYTRRGENSLLFFHSEDLFLRDLDWTVEDGTIRTLDSAGGADFDIVLTR